jgi:hypothetical protein
MVFGPRSLERKVLGMRRRGRGIVSGGELLVPLGHQLLGVLHHLVPLLPLELSLLQMPTLPLLFPAHHRVVSIDGWVGKLMAKSEFGVLFGETSIVESGVDLGDLVGLFDCLSPFLRPVPALVGGRGSRVKPDSPFTCLLGHLVRHANDSAFLASAASTTIVARF